MCVCVRQRLRGEITNLSRALQHERAECELLRRQLTESSDELLRQREAVRSACAVRMRGGLASHPTAARIPQGDRVNRNLLGMIRSFHAEDEQLEL